MGRKIKAVASTWDFEINARDPGQLEILICILKGKQLPFGTLIVRPNLLIF